MKNRINADGFTVQDVARYMALGYTLRLGRGGWFLIKLEVVT